MTTPRLIVDQEEMTRFYAALFVHADPGTLLAPRVFGHEPNSSPLWKKFAKLDGGAALALALQGAQWAADQIEGCVFCPPVCTFKTGVNAKTENLTQGLAISIECDERPEEARTKLAAILGPPTVVVASGGTWTDPDTGEVEAKLHLHWRLKVPTADAAGHAKLKRGRQLAVALVGADPSGVPIVHPMRWPGSWHRKSEPKLCRILELNQEVELDIEEALVKLEAAAPARPATSSLPYQKATRDSEADRVAFGCAFIGRCRDGAATLSEPDWYTMQGIVGRCADGEAKIHEWSRPHPRYSPAETSKKMAHALAASGPKLCVTIEAETGGRDCAKCPFRGTLRSPVALAKASPSLLTLQKRFVYEATTRQYRDLASRRMLSPESFSELHAHLFDEKERVHNVFTRSKLSPKVAYADYRPDQPGLILPEGDDLVLNLYVAGGCDPVPGDCGIILDHLAWMLPELEREHLLNLLASLIQEPGRKVKHAVLLIGEQGIGKSFLRQIIVDMIGPTNLRQIDNEELADDFKASWGNFQVLFFEELMHAGRLELANALKVWITEEQVTAHEKHIRRHQVRTPRLIVATSNHDVPIYAEPGDRRWAVLKSPARRQEPAYYERLWTEGRQQGAAFKAYLLARDLSSFSPDAPPPATEAKKELVHGSRTDLADHIAGLIEEGSIIGPLVSVSQIQSILYARNLVMREKTPPNKVATALKQVGCRPYTKGPVPLPSGRQIRIWMTPDAVDQWSDAMPAEVGQAYASITGRPW